MSRSFSPPRGRRLLTLALATIVAAGVPVLGASAAHAGDAYFPPLAADDQYEVVQGGSISIPAASGLLANDTLYDVGPLHVDATFGMLTAEGTVGPDGALDYTPDPYFVGTRTFNYQAIDEYSHMQSNVVTVTITVTPEPNQAPIANPDAYSMVQGTTLQVDAPGVLANDTDPEGDPITAVAVQGLPSAQLVLNWSGWLTFTPDPAFTGDATFQYRISDSSNLLSDWATVTITVTPKAVPEPPVANPDAYTTPKDVPLTVAGPGVLANDSLPTGLVADWLDPAQEVVVTADGGFTYTPAAGFVGTKSFTYYMSPNGNSDDFSAWSNITTVTITVTDTTEGGGDPTPGPTPEPTPGTDHPHTDRPGTTLAQTGGDSAPLLAVGGSLAALGAILAGFAIWRRRHTA